MCRPSTILPQTSHHAPRNSASGWQTDSHERSAVSVGSGMRLLPAKMHWLRGSAHQTDDRRPRSPLGEVLRSTTPKRATLRFFHSLLSFSSSSASRSCCCFTRPGTPRGVAAGQGPRGFGDLHVFDPRDQVSHSVHSEFALGPGFRGAFQP